MAGVYKIEVNSTNYNTGRVFYGTCNTAVGTAEKAVTCAEFSSTDLKAGVMVVVQFISAANTAAVANLTLNVNSTGAKSIKFNNNGGLSNLPAVGYITTGTFLFLYDGTYWVAQTYNYNTDTKVTQARGTLNNSYPILTAPTSTFGTTTTTQNTAVYHNNVFINASLGRITSNGTINAACSSAGGFNLQGAGVQYGGFYVGAQGTTTVVGNAILLAGNNTASGTAGNAQGLIRLYDSGAYYTTLKGSSASSSKEITFPNITGTVIVNNGDQTLVGTKYFGGTNTYWIGSAGNIKCNGCTVTATLTINNKILGKYTTTVNTTTSVQANNIMNAVPTAAGVDNQIVFVTVD